MSEKKSVRENENGEEHLTPHQLVNKHMENPEHEISAEEIKNLRIWPDVDEDITEKEKQKEEELENETKQQPPNPLNILDS